ncbi:GNAT family N-acetyltransferase [Streptomyces californicus]|uniref:GNAT family N-acetyltransferase n=1 Tax=Streptomyces californicus TaxID=67351 RepID=UPI0037A49D7E
MGRGCHVPGDRAATPRGRRFLGPMRLLDEVRGHGVGGRPMDEFLAWAGDAPVRLWATEHNAGAVRFYERHGSRATGERELWRGRLPNVRMVRDA